MKRSSRPGGSRPRHPVLPTPEPGPADAADGASRRHFLQLVAGAAAAPWARAALPAFGLVGAATVAAQTPETTEQPPEVEPWLAIVRQRYGDRLSSEQLKAVAENLAWTARSGKTLRGAALTNADEPDVIFRAEPPESAR